MTLQELADFGFKIYPLPTLAGDQAPPTWFIAHGDQVLVVVTEFNTEQDKNAAAFQVARLMREINAQAYLMFSEAWTVAAKTLEDARTVRASKHPDRREIIMAQGCDTRGRALFWEAAILRGDKVTLGPVEKHDGRAFEGRFANLLSVGGMQ